MKNYLKLIISMLIFGSIGVFVKNIPLTSAEIVVSRTVLGSSFLLIAMLVSRRKFSTRNIFLNKIPLLISGLALALNWVFLFESFQYISVSVAILLYYSAPIMVMILSPIILKEAIQPSKLFGIAIAMLGMFLVNRVTPASNQAFMGIAFAFLAALFYTILIFANKRIKNMLSIETTIIQLIVATVVLMPYAVYSHQGLWIIPQGISLLALLALGIVHTGLACLLYFSSINSLPAQSIALCSYIDPLSALIFSAIFLHEQLTFIQAIGAFLILFGAIFGELYAKKRQPASY